MKKVLALILILAMLLPTMSTAEGTQVTLEMYYGDCCGVYSGDLVDGIPSGHGTFTPNLPKPDQWTYAGEFKDGLITGEGVVTWQDGAIEVGVYDKGALVSGVHYHANGYRIEIDFYTVEDGSLVGIGAAYSPNDVMVYQGGYCDWISTFGKDYRADGTLMFEGSYTNDGMPDIGTYYDTNGNPIE